MELKPKVEEVSQTKRTMSFTIPKDDVQKDYQKILNQYRQYVTLPGFRKGKAPIKMIENRFKEQIMQGFLEDTVPKYYKQAMEALDKMDIHPINQGTLEKADWKPGTEMELKFSFEVAPEIELKDYKNFSVEYESEKVTDEMINDELKRLQESYATVEDKDGAAEKGDIVEYTIKSYGGKEIRKKENSSYKVGQGTYGKKFDDALLGAKIGDELTTIVQLSPQKDEDTPTEKEMIIDVIGVKKVDLPELNDDFAKEVGEFNNLAALKNEIKDGIDEQLLQRNRNQVKTLLLQKIIEKNPFEVPESMIDNYAEEMMKQYNKNQQGMNPESFQQMKNIYKSYAENELRVYYVMNKLRELEKVEVTDEEIEQDIKQAAEKMNMEVEKYKELYKKQINKEDIKESLINDRIIKNIERTVDFKKPKKKPEKKTKASKKEEK